MAFASVPEDFMTKTIGHFIGGKRVEGKSGRFGDIFNPNTGELQAKVALASALRTSIERSHCSGFPLGLIQG